MTDERERLTGALADRYRVEREVGRGGMTIVYLAEDLKSLSRRAPRRPADVGSSLTKPNSGACTPITTNPLSRYF
jgi:serine/threonine protein kinase